MAKTASSHSLTPALVLVAGILYMMSSDGQIEDKETSQLQAVIGDNENLLNFALDYVQRVPVETFLKQAPLVLSMQDKLCILTNVCDSMLSDGRCEPSELLFFETLLNAFGVSPEEYRPYFQVIQLKNDKTVLGPFAEIQDGPRISPHLTLAVSLLYMMSADGRLAQEEIGQFETVVAEFDGLQIAALGYVRANKRENFLKRMQRGLNKKQKLCVLINVCDSMMSDGVVSVVEYKLFLGIMSVFDWHIADFNKFNKVLEVKNFKPFDVSQFENPVAHLRAVDAAAVQPDVFDMAKTDDELGIEIHRTLLDNTDAMQKDVGPSQNIIQVDHNAKDNLNIQILGDTPGFNGPAELTLNSSSSSNTPTFSALDSQTSNYQALDDGVDPKLFVVLPPDVRVRNLFENIEVLTKQLDAFEAKNKLLLAVVKKAKFHQDNQRDGSETLNLVSPLLHSVKESTHEIGLDMTDVCANVQGEDIHPSTENQQALKLDALDADRQKLDLDSPTDRQRQFETRALQRPSASTGLGKTHVQSNVQSVGAHVFGSNHQIIGQDVFSANWQQLAPSEFSNDLDLSRFAANSPSLDGNVAEPTATSVTRFELVTQTTSYDTSQALQAGSEAAGWDEAPPQRMRVNPEPRLQKRDLMLYAKLATTFCMLSLWSPSTNAVRSVNPRVVTGQLVRLHQAPLVEVKLDTLSEIKTAD